MTTARDNRCSYCAGPTDGDPFCALCEAFDAGYEVHPESASPYVRWQAACDAQQILEKRSDDGDN